MENETTIKIAFWGFIILIGLWALSDAKHRDELCAADPGSYACEPTYAD